MRVLLVEDDAMIGEAVRKGLRAEGFVVDWIDNGLSAETAIRTVDYDLVVLDLGLPGKDGLQVLSGLRAAGSTLPVLVLTARDAVADRVRGLYAGADDYLVKPFDLDELVARAHGLLRRHAGRADPWLVHGTLRLNPLTREVLAGESPVSLSAREFSLLQALMDRPGAVLSVEQIQQRIYGWDDNVGSNAVEVHIHALRRKLGAEAIRNIRGVGYTLGEFK